MVHQKVDEFEMLPNKLNCPHSDIITLYQLENILLFSFKINIAFCTRQILV